MKTNYSAAPFWAFGVAVALTAPALADNVLTTHRLSAGLAAEAVTEAALRTGVGTLAHRYADRFHAFAADEIAYRAAGNAYDVSEASGTSYSFGNPDFNMKSLRGTVVLRWEYRPGSLLYFVWTQNRAAYSNPGTLNLRRDMAALRDRVQHLEREAGGLLQVFGLRLCDK